VLRNAVVQSFPNHPYAVGGDTYLVRDLLKRRGGIWNKHLKTWMMPGEMAFVELKALVEECNAKIAEVEARTRLNRLARRKGRQERNLKDSKDRKDRMDCKHCKTSKRKRTTKGGAEKKTELREGVKEVKEVKAQVKAQVNGSHAGSHDVNEFGWHACRCRHSYEEATSITSIPTCIPTSLVPVDLFQMASGLTRGLSKETNNTKKASTNILYYPVYPPDPLEADPPNPTRPFTSRPFSKPLKRRRRGRSLLGGGTSGG